MHLLNKTIKPDRSRDSSHESWEWSHKGV